MGRIGDNPLQGEWAFFLPQPVEKRLNNLVRITSGMDCTPKVREKAKNEWVLNTIEAPIQKLDRLIFLRKKAKRACIIQEGTRGEDPWAGEENLPPNRQYSTKQQMKKKK